MKQFGFTYDTDISNFKKFQGQTSTNGKKCVIV